VVSWLKEKKIPFVIRLKNNSLIDESHFGSKDLKSYLVTISVVGQKIKRMLKNYGGRV